MSRVVHVLRRLPQRNLPFLYCCALMSVGLGIKDCLAQSASLFADQSVRTDAATNDATNTDEAGSLDDILDLRLGWRPRENLEFSIVGQNLLQRHRREFFDLDRVVTGSEMDRGIYAQTVFRF